MADTWIINASPLILLARIGHLDWLEKMVANPLVPAKVIEEVLAGQAFDPTANVAVKWASHYRVENIEVPMTIQVWKIDPGESQVIAHALQQPTSYAILDDAATRRCALSLGISVFGSIGIVLRAKKSNLIPQARPWLEKLKKAGLFANDHLLQIALAKVGE